MKLLLHTLFGATLLVNGALGAYSKLAKDFNQGNFFDHFNFFDGGDPTNGEVKYTNRQQAEQHKLIDPNRFHDGRNRVFMSADMDRDYTQPNPPADKRMSVRIESKDTFTRGLFVLDLEHMPHGCGTWPAFWTLGQGKWPDSGEIDIIEGVNDQEHNKAALHTRQGCSIRENPLDPMANARILSSNCDVNAQGQASNQGCSIEDKSWPSFGAGFNGGKGGVIAMEWNKDFIKVWNFPRSRIPDAMVGTPNPEPLKWGKPSAVFSGCNIDGFFNKHRIIFNITFCGDWAGNTWDSSSCRAKHQKSCVDHVRSNPGALKEAYWLINSLKVWSS